MPLYEYECKKCGHRFERIQTYSESPIKRCPKCKKGRVMKLPSAPAVQFKGTGWYVTDYARKGTSSSLPDRGEGGKEKEAEKKPASGAASGGKEGSGKERSEKEGSGKESSARKGGKKD